MRTTYVLCMLGTLSLSGPSLAAQDHHAAVEKKGAMVMGFDQKATASFFRDSILCDLGILFFGKINNRDVGALSREQYRDAAADPGVTARNDRDFVFQLR